MSAAPDPWMEIETAPKTGETIILGYAGVQSDAGFWHDGSQNYWKREGWYDEMDRAVLLTAKPSSPTHWMPLPKPPGGRP